MNLNDLPVGKEFKPGDALLILGTSYATAYNVMEASGPDTVKVTTSSGHPANISLKDHSNVRRVTPDDCFRSQKTGHIYRFTAVDSMGHLACAKLTHSSSEYQHLRVGENLIHSFDHIKDMPRGYKVTHPLPPGTKVITNDGIERVISSVKPPTHEYAISSSTNHPVYSDDGGVTFGNASVARASDINPNWQYISPVWQAARKLNVGDIVWAHHDGATGRHIVKEIHKPERTTARGEADCSAYLISPEGNPQTVYTVKVFNVYFRHLSAEEMKEEKKKMSENKGEQKGLELWKASAVKGAYRATGRQLVAKTKSLGVIFLRSKLSAEDAASVAKFADNKYADGIVSTGIAAILTYTPMIKDRKHAKLVAEELRSDGFSHMFEGVFEFATQTLLPVILGGLNALDSFESKVDAMTAPELRVASGVSPINGISDVAIKEAEAEAAAALEAEMHIKKPTLSVVQEHK